MLEILADRWVYLDGSALERSTIPTFRPSYFDGWARLPLTSPLKLTLPPGADILEAARGVKEALVRDNVLLRLEAASDPAAG